MFKDLYKKSLYLAAHKSSKFFMSLVAFAESSFFPVPPDIMIVPMVVAKKNDYIKIFIIATISSALGGLLGYLIGATFIDLAMSMIEFYGYEEKVLNLKNNLSQGGNYYLFLGTLFLAGFTPLPFKVFTITSGMIGFNIIVFFIICLISRGLRFFVVCYLSFRFEKNLNKFMENDNSKLFIIIGFLMISLILTIYFIINKNV